MTEELLKRLVDIANERFDGHVTIMKFTTNWRVGFGTPSQVYSNKANDVEMMDGKTLEEAATKAWRTHAAAIASRRIPSIEKAGPHTIRRCCGAGSARPILDHLRRARCLRGQPPASLLSPL
jgi:hypothetical protein